MQVHAPRAEYGTETYRNWLALVTAVIGLIAAVVSLYRVAHVERELKTVTTCNGLSLWVDKPSDLQRVPEVSVARGRASVHDACKFVALILRTRSNGRPEFVVIDTTIVDGEGTWHAQIDLKNKGIDVGATAPIQVRLSSSPHAFEVGDRMRILPSSGLESPWVELERYE
jgi:hypothetical protein